MPQIKNTPKMLREFLQAQAMAAQLRAREQALRTELDAVRRSLGVWDRKLEMLAYGRCALCLPRDRKSVFELASCCKCHRHACYRHRIAIQMVAKQGETKAAAASMSEQGATSMSEQGAASMTPQIDAAALLATTPDKDATTGPILFFCLSGLDLCSRRSQAPTPRASYASNAKSWTAFFAVAPTLVYKCALVWPASK